jgi:hypothetical protein
MVLEVSIKQNYDLERKKKPKEVRSGVFKSSKWMHCYQYYDFLKLHNCYIQKSTYFLKP